MRLEDPHRPYVDDVGFPCPHCNERMVRVPEVIDVWFDSGCMPFAQWHAPFENEDHFEARFPADYICEAIDQTRGWFYSLHAVSALLFEQPAYRSVVCLGHIRDEQDRKMSKSLGNIVVPWDVLDAYGADAFRWYFFTSKQPWDGYRFSVEAVGEGVRLFLKQLWNTYAFLTLYENAAGAPAAGAAPAGEETELDRWVLSRLAATVEEVTESLEAFDATTGGRAIAAFVDDLSNWYVRRSRRRFWDGDPVAFATLRTCLVTTAKLLAPFTPFVADEIYDNLDGTEPSVHLADWPAADGHPRDLALEVSMATARETVRLGLAARGQAKVKVRQPLREAVIVAAGREREAIEQLEAIVREELNVEALRFVDEAGELGSYEVKANYRTLGPRFGKRMPELVKALAVLDPAHVAEALREGRTVGVILGDGEDHALGADDLQLAMQPLDGLPARARGLTRRRARPAPRRGAAPARHGARGHPRRAERAQERRARRRGPDHADARRRRRTARRRLGARGARGRRGARDDAGDLSRARRRRAGRDDRRSRAADRRRPRPVLVGDRELVGRAG